MTAATTPDGTDFTLICDACGQSVTGLGATMHNWDLVWSLFRRHGWTGARLATGPHSCGRCSRVPLASADADPVGWLAGDAPATVPRSPPPPPPSPPRRWSPTRGSAGPSSTRPWW